MLDRHLYSILVQSVGSEYIERYPHEFEKRIIVQKILFLLTHRRDKASITLPYDWTFYLRGPYSSEIAHMLYYMEDFLPDLKQQSLALDEGDLLAINQFKELIDSINKQLEQQHLFNALSEKIMECLATLTYISEQVEGDEEKIVMIFKRLKPDLAKSLTEELVKNLMKNLKAFHFI